LSTIEILSRKNERKNLLAVKVSAFSSQDQSLLQGAEESEITTA
jgi:hypothetical protein